MRFKNRSQAGNLLAKELKKRRFDPLNAIIAAVPRGGVVVASEIARLLKIPLTVIVVKKLGAPLNRELAIGATASFGKPVLDRWLIRELQVPAAYLKQEILKKKREAKAREKYLGSKFMPSDFSGREVIVVDDGLATGQTARAAAKIIKAAGCRRLILAVPCAAPSTVELVSRDFDEVISLVVDADFEAVGQYYRDFREVSDEQVGGMIKNFRL